MSASSIVSKIAGVSNCVVGDMLGSVLESNTNGSEGDTWLAATTLAGDSLTKAGHILSLGALQGVSIKSDNNCWVVAYRSGNAMIVECDTTRTATSVEAALAGVDWAAAIEPPICESDIEPVPESQAENNPPVEAAVARHNKPESIAERLPVAVPPKTINPRPQNAPPRTAAIDDLPRATVTTNQPRTNRPAQELTQRRRDRLELLPEESLRPAPPVPPKVAVPRPPPAVAATSALPRVAPATLSEAEMRTYADTLNAEFRRALVKGQIAQAEIIVTKLMNEPKKGVGQQDATLMQTQLFEGIASVLAGDAFGGLTNLKMVEKRAIRYPTLRWAALIWCARASAGAGEGLDVASNYAKSALTLAANFDAEARAVSTFELAGVVFHQGDCGEALDLTRTARAQFANTSDPHLLASCWLLEARVLASIGNHEESISAAGHAREQRPSWPPPLTFIARRALQDGRLNDANTALQPLLDHKPTAVEVERMRCVLEHVRVGAATTRAACEFLELVDAPPTLQNIHRLEELSDAHPKIHQFRDALGWQFLRAGHYESAGVVFEGLSARDDVTEEVRSSVLLALGYLAATGTGLAKPGVKIRAAIGATPKNFKSSKPLPPQPSSTAAAMVDVDLHLSEIPAPPSSVPLHILGGERPSSMMASGGHVFSGNLQLISLPELLEFLRSGQRTGTLLCSSTAGIGAIQMRKGRITGAASPRTKELESYLVANGFVTPAALQNVARPDQNDKTLIGGLLVKCGLVTAEQVRVALRDQIRDAIKEVMGWGVGQFAFNPEAPAELSVSDIEIEIDPQEMLLDIFKEMDERSKSFC